MRVTAGKVKEHISLCDRLSLRYFSTAANLGYNKAQMLLKGTLFLRKFLFPNKFILPKKENSFFFEINTMGSYAGIGIAEFLPLSWKHKQRYCTHLGALNRGRPICLGQGDGPGVFTTQCCSQRGRTEESQGWGYVGLCGHATTRKYHIWYG